MNFSMPTKQQLIHGAERTLLVFVMAVAGYFKLTGLTWTSAAWSAAGWAGVAAVYQLILSTLTNL